MGKHKLKSKPGPSFKTNGSHTKSKKGIHKKFPKSGKQKQKIKEKSKLDYAAMSVDEFMNKDFDSSDDSSKEQGSKKIKLSSKVKNIRSNDLSEVKPNNPKQKSASMGKQKSQKIKNDVQVDGNDNEGNEANGAGDEKPLWGDANEELDDGNSDNYENEIVSHKASLDKLKKTDPEFYKFLQDNDKKLLQFNISDSEQEDEDDEDDQVHKPTGDLEVASDESDFEDDADDKEGEAGQQIVTLRMLKNWQAALQTDKSNKTIGCLVNAFHAALLRVSNEENEVGQYKVDGSSVFNAVIQLCVLELSPAIRRFLGLTSSKMQPHKCKKFVKVKLLLRSYFTDLLKLLGGVTSTNILTILLKHLHHMTPLLFSFPKISKPMVKKLIHLWGTGDEVVRILAFLCILRITNNQLASLLDTVLKSMYMTYVINSKFVSVNSLSSINFMRRSLAEMFALDPSVSYQHVFLYIRQLAIHLRNAIVVHKKENIQTVYNWQFINSLKLWGNLLAVTHGKPQLQPLVYPFVQVCLGTLKLVPTAQYYPLRFQVVQVLVDFSRGTGVFIPILPFILEVLNDYDFNKKHKKASMKPLNFTCLLRGSNSQMSESGYKDAVIENIYALLLEYLTSQSNSIAFPDLTLFCVLQIKQFLKKCNNFNYNKKMKQIIEKINQNNEFIERERKNITFTLTNYDKITAWETTVRNKGTPMSVFYENWNKMRTIKKKKEATDNDKLGDYNLPTIKKIKKDGDKMPQDNKSFDPFPSDSDSDDQINFDGEKKEKSEDKTRQKRGKKRRKRKAATSENGGDYSVDIDDGGQQDVVEDLNVADW